MYGLVFEIVEEWVIEKQGVETWHDIKDKAGCNVKDQAFLRRKYYPDEELVVLIVAASELLGIAVPDILESFGHYVIRHHFLNGYDDLLRCQGSTLRQWLSNLNAMHDHVQKTFPGENFQAPIFWCEDCEEVEGSILLHYYSLRGSLLVPMVVGIVEELASFHFEVEVKMHQLSLQDVSEASFTTWRITAVDENQQWKLSPRAQGQDMSLSQPVSFENVQMPSKCPFTGKPLERIESPTCPLSESSCLSLEEGDQVGLTLQKMQEVFPFHVLVKRDFAVIQVGNSLPSLLDIRAQDLRGRHIQDFLEISRPVLGSSWDWMALNKLADQHFFLVPKSDSKTLHKRVSMEDSSVKFKGSMISVSVDKVMFVLAPDARNVVDLNNMGLTMSDLPLQSCQRDTVFLGEYITQEVDKAHKLDKLSKKLTNEKNLSNTLLYNILPKQVAESLRAGNMVEPEFHENVTVFFSDIEGFTSICDKVDPWDVIDMLNQLYSVMDFLATHFNLYKVETIGDAYMCCSGLPEPDECHAENIANFALAVVECIKHVKSPVDGLPLNLRVGIHTGGCTSGVVGTLTPHYCLFGDMVNTTARHESTGVAGRIHCSSVLFGRLKHFSMFGETEQYSFTPRGLVDMKGKGECYTYWLESGSARNEAAGPKAIERLSDKVAHMLSKKKWKMRRYFRRSGDLRDEISEGATTITMTESSDTGVSEDCAQAGPNAVSASDGESLDSANEDIDLHDLMDPEDIDDVINFMEEQKGQLEVDTWGDLRFKEDLPFEDLRSRVHGIVSVLLFECVHVDEAKLESISRQLLDYIERLSMLYNEENHYHNFHRAAHVLLCANHLWGRASINNDRPTYGRDRDPWDHFIIVLAALIHDVQHQGVTNAQLEAENHETFLLHGGRGSCQQKQALHSALSLLEDEFQELYDELVFGCPKFLHLVRKLVLATNFESAAELLKNIDNFDRTMGNSGMSDRSIMERNQATMEIIIAMAAMGHFAQDYQVFLQWNQASFQENLQAHSRKHGNDPRDGWYVQQTECFENLVLPLIDLVERVLPPSSCNLRKRAEKNMQAWKEGGREWLEAYKLHSASIEDVLGKTELCHGLEDLTSQIRERRIEERISKAVERYEKKLEAACNALIAVTYKENEDSAKELKKKPVTSIGRNVRQQGLYKSYSDDGWSGGEGTDPIDQDNANPGQKAKKLLNEALHLVACTSGGELSLGGAAALKLSISGEEYLKVDGSMHGGLGRVLTSISTQDDVTVNSINDTWSAIALITKDSQSQEIHDRLDTIIAYCLKVGLLVQV